jgi:heptosyltransferase-2
VGAVLDLHGKVRSKLIRLVLLRTRAAVWTRRGLRVTLAVKLGLRPYRAGMRLADRYHAAVEALVGRSLPHGRLRYWLGPDDRRLADEALAAAGVSSDRPLLGLSPGARWETKLWPAERFGELARRALERGWQVAIAGSADEAPLGRIIQSIAPGTVDISGQLDLRGLGGFISRCAAFVANDSGPMHLARALGVPTLSLFGSTDPGMFSWDGHAVLFNRGVECAPCSFYGRRRCPKGHFRCMLELGVEEAWTALVPLMDGRPRPPLSG